MPKAAGTAKILILIGLILQGIEVAVLVLLGLVALVAPFAALIFLPLAIVGIVWVVLVYVFSYRRVYDGDYEGARTPTLVFGILSLITVNIVSGVLYLVAYSEIGSAQMEQAALMRGGYPGAPPVWGAPPASAAPPGGAGAPTRFCPFCGRPNRAVGRFCPDCGAAFP